MLCALGKETKQVPQEEMCILYRHTLYLNLLYCEHAVYCRRYTILQGNVTVLIERKTSIELNSLSTLVQVTRSCHTRQNVDSE